MTQRKISLTQWELCFRIFGSKAIAFYFDKDFGSPCNVDLVSCFSQKTEMQKNSYIQFHLITTEVNVFINLFSIFPSINIKQTHLGMLFLPFIQSHYFTLFFSHLISSLNPHPPLLCIFTLTSCVCVSSLSGPGVYTAGRWQHHQTMFCSSTGTFCSV